MVTSGYVSTLIKYVLMKERNSDTHTRMHSENAL